TFIGVPAGFMGAKRKFMGDVEPNGTILVYYGRYPKLKNFRLSIQKNRHRQRMSVFRQYDYFTGTTDPPHSLNRKSWISLDFNASTKALISLLSSSPDFTAMIFIY